MNDFAAFRPTPSARIMPVHSWLAEFYGIDVARVRCVARLDCEIYRVSMPGLPDLALRIYPTRIVNETAIADEVNWLVALGAEGLHVPTPQPALDGRFIQRWPDGRLAVVLSWVQGRLLDKALRPVHLQRVGRLAGAMHRVAERMVANGQIVGQRLGDGDGPDLTTWADGSRVHHPAMPEAAHRRVQAAARRLIDELASFPRDRSAWGFVHADLHPWNLLFEGTAAGAIDFSECGYGHHALDLAAALQYLKHPVIGACDHAPLYPRHRAALLEGYAEERPLPPGIERQLDAYIEIRMINTIEWVLDCWPTLDERPWGRGFLQRAGEFFDH
ncbi:MAG TPA: phosphotransferase [Ideonella sp.]|uniref:phosphotransferase enzyme family protein n=1 Tax=Ideonella sp. TaxID=1929293 RepID=UPI002E341FFE|nr:phosphotransferase [Ideonella sp.]HEX5684327.1 phosphotransferase [Ideonella sp.]